MRSRRQLTDRDRVLRSVPEKEFMAQIIEAAEWLGYRTYHVNDSRRDAPGFPDVWCVGRIGTPVEGRLVIIETKRETGQLTTDQALWLMDLERLTRVDVRAARPSQVDEIMALLQAE